MCIPMACQQQTSGVGGKYVHFSAPGCNFVNVRELVTMAMEYIVGVFFNEMDCW